MSSLSKYQNLCDLHTHTIFSKHGVSSPSEMVDHAILHGLKYIALTDHFYPENKSNKPDYDYLNTMERCSYADYFSCLIDQIHVIPGGEFNLFNDDFVSLRANKYSTELQQPEAGFYRFNLIGLHDWFVDVHKLTAAQFVMEIASVAASGAYNCVSHVTRGIHKIPDVNNETYNKIINDILRIFVSANLPFELNETDCRMYFDNRYSSTAGLYNANALHIAKKLGLYVLINTDSHAKYTVGKIPCAMEMLDECNYPVDKIINFDEDKIKDLLKGRLTV